MALNTRVAHFLPGEETSVRRGSCTGNASVRRTRAEDAGAGRTDVHTRLRRKSRKAEQKSCSPAGHQTPTSHRGRPLGPPAAAAPTAVGRASFPAAPGGHGSRAASGALDLVTAGPGGHERPRRQGLRMNAAEGWTERCKHERERDAHDSPPTGRGNPGELSRLPGLRRRPLRNGGGSRGTETTQDLGNS